jgi:hypothetical protein
LGFAEALVLQEVQRLPSWRWAGRHQEITKKKAVSHVQTIESSSSRTHSFRHHSIVDFAKPDQGDRLVDLEKTAAGL